jgi:polar amino acid transport system substrate-binding protein
MLMKMLCGRYTRASSCLRDASRLRRRASAMAWPLARLLGLGLFLFGSLLPISTINAQELSSQRAAARDLQSIIDVKVLRVAITGFDLPSFHVHGSDGRLVGPEIEMAEQIGRALGVKIEFVEDANSFNSVVDLVAAGQADIGISKLSQTYGRLRHVRFSEPYVTLRHALLFNRAIIAREANGRPPATALHNFRGRIGVIAESAYVNFAKRNFPEATVVEEHTWDNAIESLLNGQVDAVYRDEFEIRRVLKNRPALNVQFGAAAIIDQNALLSVAICDSCAKLQEFINYHVGLTKGPFELNALLNSEIGK